jgi:hypothetical protein
MSGAGLSGRLQEAISTRVVPGRMAGMEYTIGRWDILIVHNVHVAH